MVVKFNEKVETCEYTPPPAQGHQNGESVDEIEPTKTVVGVSSSKRTYDPKFLLELRDSPNSQICPDIIKNGIESLKGWVRKEDLPNGHQFARRPFIDVVRPNENFATAGTSSMRSGRRSVFMNGPPQTSASNYRFSNNRPSKLVPWTDSNPTNFSSSASTRDILKPLQSEFDRFHSQQRSHQYDRRTFASDYSRAFKGSADAHKMNNPFEHQDEEPEWVKDGPTSQNDVIELHGFDGIIDEPEGKDKHKKKVSFESTGGSDANISGHNSSPPARSTPAKPSPMELRNDVQRNKRPGSGRFNMTSKMDSNTNAAAQSFHDFMKAARVNQMNQSSPSNIRYIRLEDIESAVQLQKMHDNLAFRQMLSQVALTQATPWAQQNALMNLLKSGARNSESESRPFVNQVATEVEKMIQSSQDPNFKRPEVRSLVNNVIKSAITTNDLLNLSKNPLTEPKTRETITVVLKLVSDAVIKATEVLAGKLPNTRTAPSAAQLHAHTDAIMQNAILKKKLDQFLQNSHNISTSHANAHFGPIGGNRSARSANAQSGANRNVPIEVPKSSLFQKPPVSQPDVEAGAAPLSDFFLKRLFSPNLWDQMSINKLPKIKVGEAINVDEYERLLRQNNPAHPGKENKIV